MLSSATGSKTALSPTTAEFGYLEYALQISLKASTARITQAYAISNPHLTTQFDRKCKDILTLNSWIDSSALCGVNTEEEVVRRGFQFSSTGTAGIKVPVGSLKKSIPAKATTKIVRKLLFCKVGVGRAFVADETSLDTTTGLPDGYDSFYIHDKSSNPPSTQSQPCEYYHEYYLSSSANILPQFVVHCEYDPSREKKSLEVPSCDNCEEELAAVYCSSDKANLCNKCDTKLHQAKVASRHVRSPIGRGGDLFGNCRHHMDEQIKYYCSQCHIPVCVVCKMVGNHSNGEANRHQLVSVSEAYQAVMQEANMPDPVLQSRRTEINNQIAAVNSRAKAVDKMGQMIQAQIDEIHKCACDDLRMIIKRKMDVLLGDQLELKRQISEYDRLEDFVRYQMQGDPTQFLFSWSRQSKLRAELHDFRFFREELDVMLDIKVSGGISVQIDQDPIQSIDECSTANMGVVSTSPKKNQSTSGMIAQQQQQQPVGLGVPKKLSERRVQRRTSDFFAETIGEFDQFSLSNEQSF